MTNEEFYRFSVESPHNKERIDKYLNICLPDFSRSRLQAIIEAGHITINGVTITSTSRKVATGEECTITIPPAQPTDLIPLDIPLSIVFEDEHLIVVNKPAGMTVHPGAGNHQDTLVNALVAHCGKGLSQVGGVERPGIVHRLDKDTSGLMLVAKNDHAHHHLAAQLKERTLGRFYYTICWGIPSQPEGVIEVSIGRSAIHRKKMAVVDAGGKKAITRYNVLETFCKNGFSLVECQLKTGRTHQIRVHLTHVKHPIVGDATYGSPHKGILARLPEEISSAVTHFSRQALHAKTIYFIHPVSGQKMRFDSELPADMAGLLELLRSED